MRQSNEDLTLDMQPSSGIVNTDLYVTSDESLPQLLFTFYSFSAATVDIVSVLRFRDSA